MYDYVPKGKSLYNYVPQGNRLLIKVALSGSGLSYTDGSNLSNLIEHEAIVVGIGNKVTEVEANIGDEVCIDTNATSRNLVGAKYINNDKNTEPNTYDIIQLLKECKDNKNILKDNYTSYVWITVKEYDIAAIIKK